MGRLARIARGIKRLFTDKRHRVTLAVGGMAAFGLFTAFMAYSLIWQATKIEEEPLAAALIELRAGRFAEARLMAEQLAASENLSSEQLGGPPFIFGAVALNEAQHTWDESDKRRLFLLAARYLERARDLGFPQGTRADGLFYLGESLFYSGRYEECMPVLEQSLEFDVPQEIEVCRLLAEAQLNQGDPDFSSALQWNRRYLGYSDLAQTEQDSGYLQQCDILLQMQDREAAQEALSHVSQSSGRRAEAMVMLGRIKLLDAEQQLAAQQGSEQNGNQQAADALLREAVAILEEASLNDTLAAQARRKSAYLIGLAYRRLGDREAARDQLQLAAEMYAETPDGFAAALELAEVQLELNEPELAFRGLRELLKDAPLPQSYHNPWITLSELQQRLLRAADRLVEKQHYDFAVELARALYPTVPQQQSVELAARYQKAWAQQLAEQAAAVDDETTESLLVESRRQYRGAGTTYARLALLQETTRQYPANVWESGECFLAGHDYENAVVMYREYLENEARGNRPQALVGLGQALLALEQSQAAIEIWTECIEIYPSDPATYRARIFTSQAQVELGLVDEAETLLRHNLDHSDLTPASLEWRDSLYALGKLKYSQGVIAASAARRTGLDGGATQNRAKAMEELEKSFEAFDEATRLLWWAVQRHPDAPQATEARYLVAESYRQAGAYLLEKRRDAGIESMRMTLYSEAQEKYEAALEHYTHLQEELNNRQQSLRPLSEWEAKVLRNCYFARGTVLFDLERYDDAIQAYSSATSRFQHSPEALEAYVQIAASQRRLQRYVAARGTLEQARLMLDRIDSNADFTATTRYSREEWITLLDWLSTI